MRMGSQHSRRKKLEVVTLNMEGREEEEVAGEEVRVQAQDLEVALVPASGGGSGSGTRGNNSVSKGVEEIKRLVANKEFKFAANVAVGTALKMTGTDTLAAAVIAGAKGYQEYRTRSRTRVRKGTVEFAKGQISGAVAGAIASNAVGSVSQSLKIQCR